MGYTDMDLPKYVFQSIILRNYIDLFSKDEQLAKKCIPVFVCQLKENTDHCVRNNIVVVICDLCIR